MVTPVPVVARRAASVAAVFVSGALALAGPPAGGAPAVPDWAYPLNPPATVVPPATAHDRALHVPGSAATFAATQLADLFFVPDWHPHTHAPMPASVATGRRPDVYACGHCHLPGGRGRPENAPLAGLPADYIVRQVADIRSGARRSAAPDAFLPEALMLAVAAHASEAEVGAAAQYFAAERLSPLVTVIERARVPRTRVAGWVYVAEPERGEEPLGERLLEVTPDLDRHERRDDQLHYVAWVPPGSIGRGRGLARAATAQRPACTACHGAGLGGVGAAPPLAGRSPIYLLRQLLAFRSGARAGSAAPPMQAAAAPLSTRQFIDLAAYAASLPPGAGPGR